MTNNEQGIDLKQITIGRLVENDVVLEPKNISRSHARVTICAPTVYLIEDLDSKHGTFVNGERIRRKLIAEEDKIGLATHEFFLKEILTKAQLVSNDPARKGKSPLDYTAEFEAMKELYKQYKLFEAEEGNIRFGIRKVQEKLRLGGALTAPTIVGLKMLFESSIFGAATVVAGGAAATAAAPATFLTAIAACGLGMLIPAIGSRFLNEDEKLEQPKLYFKNSWKCPKCGDKVGWLNKSWQQIAQQKKCSECDAIYVK